MAASHADIAIQSNAPPEEHADNGKRRINSGFYYVKSQANSVEAFRQITEHARQSSLSEQPSFYTILCGDDVQYTVASSYCHNPLIPISTKLLSRQLYPNGAMREVTRGVTPSSVDDVAIVHANWLAGHDKKVEHQKAAHMWFLDGKGRCKWRLPKQAGREGPKMRQTTEQRPRSRQMS